MNILTISGSARTNSANIKLLKALPMLFPTHTFQRFPVEQLPLFHADLQQQPTPKSIIDWKSKLSESDAVIMSTPEYTYNIPAILKNALEWVTDSGELHKKKVLAITFAPAPGRAEKAMQSLLWTLQGLKSDVVTQLPLFQNEILFDDNDQFVKCDELEMLKEAISLLK